MTVFFKQVHRALLKTIIVMLLVALFFLMWVPEARSESPQFSGLRTDYQRTTTPSGANFRYKLDYFLNQHGEKEVQISLIEAHWLSKDTHLSVLKGRDINSDGLIETWFYNEGPIVKAFQRATETPNAWPVAEKILTELSLNESRWISTLAARELLADLFFTVEGELQDSREMEQTQIDLLDLDFKIKEFIANNESPQVIQELKRVSDEGWRKLLDRWTRTKIDDRHKRILGDMALFVGGAVALKGVRFLAIKTLSTQTVSSIKGYMREAIDHQKVWTQKMVGRVSPVLAKHRGVINASVSRASLQSANIGTTLRFASESEALAWVSRNSVFTKTLKHIGGLIKDTASASWDRRGYIAIAQTIQLAIESYTRGYWQFSEAPLILDHPVASTKEFIHQVANDKGLLQNLSYMTLQTTLLSGASEALSRKGAGLGVKFAVCSMITLIDSIGVNILIQGSTNYSRVSFDTAWELVVGGSQVHMDMHLLRWANGLAQKYNNSKLKIVGYLLGSLDQAAGYALYHKATSELFEGAQGYADPAPAPAAPVPAAAPVADSPILTPPSVIIVPVLAPRT